MTRHFLDNIELWLSAAGVGVILAAPALISPVTSGDYWRVVAVTAVSVGVLHGVIFWMVRRRQRQLRSAAIAEIRGMLRDVINNKLTVILGSSRGSAGGPDRADLEALAESVRQISELVNTLSLESLQRWQHRYRGVIQ